MNDNDNTLSRENFMRRLHVSWEELQNYLATLTDEQLTIPTDAGGWTAKDHFIHLAKWENAGHLLLEGIPARETLDIPLAEWDAGEDPTNAIIQARFQNMPVEEVKQTLKDNHAKLLAKLETMSEEDLLKPFKHYHPDSTEDRPIIWWVIGNTMLHYRDHLPWIQAIVEKA